MSISTYILPIRKSENLNLFLIKGIMLLITFISSLDAFGQKETSNWFFGQWAGLDFNSTPPNPLINGSLRSPEGCATISDVTGKLLFYTNGEYVWNKMHQIMVNGTGLWGHESTSQSALIVKQPSKDLYYIFTVDAQAGNTGGYGGIAYSIVNMNSQNRLGIVTIKNTPLLTPTSEKVTAVHHKNGRDIWIMTQHWGSNSKYAWLLTSNGLDSIPIISKLGIVHNKPQIPTGHQAQGYMKFSHNGKRVANAVTLDGIIELYDFDDSTGFLSNLKTLNKIDNPYGLEFSPNDNILYTSTFTSRVYQYNLALTSEQLINNSRFLLYQIPNSRKKFVGLQLGLDAKIYVAISFLDSLGVITQPNSLGASSNYKHNAVSLNGRTNNYGLPNFVQSYFSNVLKSPDPAPPNTNNGISINSMPFSSNFIINVKSTGAETVEVYLYNDLGQLIFTIKKNNIHGQYTTLIDLDRYAKAIYFIIVATNEGRVVKKVIKQ